MRPETKRYNHWCKTKKEEEEFKFKEVLPFGGVINRNNDPQQNINPRSEPFSNVVFHPDESWNKRKNVSVSVILIINQAYICVYLNK